jgi:3-hydroxymyristoyl/3-hydroxydecanoyl-(acyl carrier protein) dehydratase
MLPVDDFDAPEALRARLELLRNAGAPAGRFHGVAMPALSMLEGEPGRLSRASLGIPVSAPFFADHFPRRPVFPATLLLDSQIRLALDLARAAVGPAVAGSLVPRRMSNVKMRSFIEPGSRVLLEAQLASANDIRGPVRLSASIDGRTVATARLDLGPKEH